MVEQMQCAVDSIQWVVQKWGTYIFAMVYIYIYIFNYIHNFSSRVSDGL